MNKRGYTLLELTLIGSLFGAVVLMASFGLQSLRKVEKHLTDRSTMGTDLVTVSRYISRVGRVAQLCRRVVVGGADTLECNIDFTRPATGVLSWVRFVVVSNYLELQEDDNNDGNFTATTTRTRFPGVESFVVCGDSRMNLGTGGDCPIKPDNISTFHTNILLGPKAGRFFRFSILSTPTSGAGDAASVKLAFQGAFYRRNPTPFTSPVVVYQW